MLVVLDSSIFCRDFSLRGKAFSVFLDSLEAVPARVCVPEIVLDEVLVKYSEEVSRRTQDVNSALEQVRRLMLDEVPPCLPAPEVESLTERFAEYLRKRLREADAEFLPYPTEPHQEVVQRALQRQKPFRESGQGYRDYLIWLSIRKKMYYAPEETVVFVTGNTRDFCDGEGLAASLLDEVARYHHSGRKVVVCPSLDAFNAVHIVPRLERKERLRDALVPQLGRPFDLHRWAVRSLPRLLQSEEYAVVATHGLEPEQIDCRIVGVDTIDDLEISEARTMPTGRTLVSARARVSAVIGLEVSGRQFERYREARELGLGSWEEKAELTVHFSLVLDEAASDPQVSEIDSIEGPAGTLRINDLPRSDLS